jgi:sugar lactone lactonase YvrE
MKSTTVLLSLVAALLAAAPAASASVPAGHVETVVALDYAAGQHPEGLAVAPDGSLYVGMAPTGQLTRITTEGVVTDLGAPAFPADAGYLLGLATDAQDQVYGAVVRFDGGPTGVWRYDAGAGTWELFAATDPAGFPNGLAFTADGTLLVSDMTLGTIWAVDPSGEVSTWLHDPRLLGGGEMNAGVNGLAIGRSGAVWYTNSERATLGKIRVDENGDPVGRPRVVARDDRMTFADGLALDADGTAWVAASYGSDRLLRVSHRTVCVVASRRDGLDYTATPAFGPRRTLYFTNSGDDFAEPSVMSIRRPRCR